MSLKEFFCPRLGHLFKFWLPENYVIDPWLLGEKRKPTIICDADVALHFELILVSEKLARQTYGGLAHLGLLGM